MTDELKRMINDAEMMEEYRKVLAHFQDDLHRRLCLKLTPEILYSIAVCLFGYLYVSNLNLKHRFQTNECTWVM